MKRPAVHPCAWLFGVLLLALSFAQQACAAYAWLDSRPSNPVYWNSADDACRLGEAQRYLDENNLSNNANYRYDTVSAQQYTDTDSQCTYIISQRIFGLWLPIATPQVDDYRVGAPDLCFNGMILDANGRCQPKNAAFPSCPNNGSNPINGATANKYEYQQDYIGAGPFPLSFERHYNSVTLITGPLGANWRGSYERTLSISLDGSTVTEFRPAWMLLSVCDFGFHRRGLGGHNRPVDTAGERQLDLAHRPK